MPKDTKSIAIIISLEDIEKKNSKKWNTHASVFKLNVF